MKHQDKELQMYAENGLRTAEDWASLGRAVVAGAGAKTDATIRGRVVALYERSQTEHQPSTRAGRLRERAAAVTPGSGQ